MKVGIIGLQPRQIRDVGERKFNGHEVEFYNEKTYSQEKVAAFVRRMDKVIWLPGHTPKKLDEWITKTKLQTMMGGMSSVVRYLSTLPQDTAETTRPVEVKKVSPPVEVETAVLAGPVIVTVQPPKKLGATIPKGRESQYTWSPDVGIVHPNESGEHRYDLLDAALPGDVLRLARPQGVEYQVWRTRITSTRYSREKTKGQILEAHYYEGYVDLLVVNTDGKVEAVTDSAESEQSQEVVKDAASIFIQDVPPPQGSPDVRPVPTKEEVAKPASLAGDVAMDFWMKTFLAYTDRLDPTTCAGMADTSLRLLRDRYPNF
jgi:hypothetical protein